MSVKQYLLEVNLERLDEGGYFAIAPTLEGCHAEGDTIAEALDNLDDVARMIIEFSAEKGLPLPPELRQADQVVLKAELVVEVGV